MNKAEDRGGTYALHKASEKLHDYYGNAMLSVVQFDGYDIKNAYIDGYHQAEKDLELTWEDISYIVKTYSKIEFDKNYKWVSFSEACKETLNRFNKQKEDGKV